jgi:lipoprotein signal peptidase
MFAWTQKIDENLLLRIMLLLLLDLSSKLATMHVHMGLVQSTVNVHAAWGLAIPLNILILASVVITSIIAGLVYAKHIVGRSGIFIIAWSLGNLYDRIIYHGVRDRIMIWSFPVFNIADVMITVGALLFLYEQFKHTWKTL